MHTLEFLKGRIEAGETVSLGKLAFDKANEGDLGAAYEEAQAGIQNPPESPSSDALVKRNGDQADLIDALTKDPKDLARLDKAALAAVAKFEGVAVDGRAGVDAILKAIAEKRGA